MVDVQRACSQTDTLKPDLVLTQRLSIRYTARPMDPSGRPEHKWQHLSFWYRLWELHWEVLHL